MSKLSNNLINSLAVVLLCVFNRGILAAETKMISAETSGTAGNSSSYFPKISADGRYVVYESNASNLVDGDTNAKKDIFVYDHTAQETRRVSIDSTGIEANGDSSFPVITPDGRYIAFDSDATNLVAGDTNSAKDVFIHDRATQQTHRVSVKTGGLELPYGANNDGATNHTMTPDGRFVVFSSCITVPGGEPSHEDNGTFIFDRKTGETQLVSVNSSGLQSSGCSFFPKVSADGHLIAFVSTGDDLVDNDTNNSPDIFVHDRTTGQTALASVDSNGILANAGVNITPRYVFDFSYDGRVVLFKSKSTNLVEGVNDGRSYNFVHDRLTGQTVLSSQYAKYPLKGLQINTVSFSVADDRYTTYPTSFADTSGNTTSQIIFHDKLLNTTQSTDLTVTASAAPESLTPGGIGLYTFTVTNNGPVKITKVSVTHVPMGGTTLSLTTGSNPCLFVSTVSVCKLSSLLPGQSKTFQAEIQAVDDVVTQQVSIAANPLDIEPFDNYLSVTTPVTP